MDYEPITTTDLAKFGSSELQELAKLIKTLHEQGLPKNFHNDDVLPTMNIQTGEVFLANSDYQVALLDRNGNLRNYCSCLECGFEAFEGDSPEDWEPCCKEFINGEERPHE